VPQIFFAWFHWPSDRRNWLSARRSVGQTRTHLTETTEFRRALTDLRPCRYRARVGIEMGDATTQDAGGKARRSGRNRL
jgi:hypothetical protein